MRVSHTISLVFVAVLLSGCARQASDSSAMAPAGSFQGRAAGLATAVPAGSALALLPSGAGRIVQVAERRYSDGLAQDIILEGGRSTHGENRIEVAMRLTPDGETLTDNLVPLARTSDVAIASEIETRFPGMRMEIVNVLLQNRHGPYGMAAGRGSNGERCIYAWQWIDDIRNTGGSASQSLASALLSPPQPASLRVRLCRAGASADQLAALVNDLVLGGRGRRQLPVLGAAGGGGDALSAANGGMASGQDFAGYQLPAASSSEASAPGRRASRKPVRLARQHRHQGQRQLALQPQDYAPQPQPQPQAYAPQPQAYAPQPQAYAPQPQPQAYAPQPQPQAYGGQPPVQVRPVVEMQPQANPAPQARIQQMPYAPPQIAPAPAMRRPLDPSLPARAYRGPQGASAQELRTAPRSGGPASNGPVAAMQQLPAAQTAPGGRLQRDPVNPGAGI